MPGASCREPLAETQIGRHRAAGGAGLPDQPADPRSATGPRRCWRTTARSRRSARRSATTSTAWSTRSTTSRCSAGSASAPPRPAGRSRTSSRPSWPGPGSRRSTSRSAAPARCRPVARLTPVTVGGVVVSNATLHNEDYIAGRDADGDADPRGQRHPRRRLGAGLPRRRRDPQDRRRRPVAAARRMREPYAFPRPARNAAPTAIREEGDAVRRCTGGLICPAQAVEKLKHFVSPRRLRHRGAGRQAGRGVLRRRAAGSGSPPTSSPCEARDGERPLQQLKNREGWGETSVDEPLRTPSTRSGASRWTG